MTDVTDRIAEVLREHKPYEAVDGNLYCQNRDCRPSTSKEAETWAWSAHVAERVAEALQLTEQNRTLTDGYVQPTRNAVYYASVPEVAYELSTVTYKPGFTFSMFEHRFEGWCVRIVFDVPDSYRPGETQTQGVNVPIPPLTSSEHFHDWLQWRLERLELHEVREFYRVGGVVLHDPHSSDYWELKA